MRKHLVFILLLALASLNVGAQVSTGDLVGQVTLAEGGPLPGVSVTLSGAAIGTRAVTTSAEGHYRFLRLPPGNYELKFELTGFKTVERKDIRVSIGSTVELNIVMEQGTIEETVVVVAGQPLIDTRKATVAMNMSKEEMDVLPTGRSATSVIIAAPGVASYNQGKGQTAIYGVGTRDTQNRWSVDGASVDGVEYGGTLGTSVNIDTLEETQVSVSAHDITNITGGISVNFVTKRGGNRYSGHFFTRIQDNAFTLEQTLPKSMAEKGYVRSSTKHGYWYGAGLGGPIWKDHLWFYGTFANSDVTSINSRGTESRSGYTPFYNIKGSFQYWKFNGDVSYQWYKNDSTSPYSRSSAATKWGSEICYFGGIPVFTANLNAAFGNLLASVKFTRMKGSSGLKPGPFGDLVGGATYNDGGEFIVPFAAAFGYNFADPIHSLLGHKAGVGTMQPQTTDRPYIIGSVNYFAENLIGGRHEFLLGADYEDAHYTRQVLWPNHSYIFWNYADSKAPGGRLDWFMFYSDWNLDKQTKRNGIFFQDTATYGRMTVNLGLRYDFYDWIQNPSTKHPLTPWLPELGTWATPEPLKPWIGQTVSSPKASLNDFGINITAFSPRISLAYDLFGDGKTIAKIAFAHYGGNLYNANMPELAPGGGMYTLTFPFKDANGNGWPDAGEFAGWNKVTPPLIKGYRDSMQDPFFSGNLWNYYNYSSITLSGPPEVSGLSSTKFDPDFRPPKVNEIVVGVERQLSKDIAVALTGTYKKNYNMLRADSWYKGKDGSVVLPTQDLYIQYETDPFTNRPIYKTKEVLDRGGAYITTQKKSYEYVYGLEGRFTKKLSNRWMLNASFNFNEYKRRWFLEDFPGQFAIDYYDKSSADPSMWGSGNIYPNPVWLVKINGLYQLPLGFTISALILGNDGYPVRDYVGAYSGYYIPPTDRKFGDVRLDDYWQVNLGLEKKFHVSEGVSAVLSVQAFNIFNNTKVTLVDMYRIPQDLGNPQAVTSPAYFELGARVNF